MLQYSADWLPLLTITSNANASRTKTGLAENYDLVVSIIGLFFPQTKPHMGEYGVAQIIAYRIVRAIVG